MDDFRSDPMPSSEGRGRARAAWDAYSRGVNRVITKPLLEGVLAQPIKEVSITVMADLIGFWFMWHTCGGFEGLRKLGMSRATIFRRVNMFRKYFGQHPDEFMFPGVTLDLDELHKHA